MKQALLITTPLPDMESAQALGEALVEKKLAASVHIAGPIQSIFRWKGEIRKRQEWICQVRTIEKNWSEIESFIKKNHPYEVPEILGFPIPLLSQDSKKWLIENSGENE